jgi:small-conductance mechanosensitive channel
MMEIGNWIGGDQYSGRIIQFANAQVFGSSVFNYTRNFAYIWDEIKLPITYASNIKAAAEILKSVGGEYTREFMQDAEPQIERMQRIFMVPRFPAKIVKMKIAKTTNARQRECRRIGKQRTVKKAWNRGLLLKVVPV